MAIVSQCQQFLHGRIFYCSWYGRGQSYFSLSLDLVGSECSEIQLGGTCLLSVRLVDSWSESFLPWLVILNYSWSICFGGLMCVDPLLLRPSGGSFPWFVNNESFLLIRYSLLWVEVLVRLVPLELLAGRNWGGGVRLAFYWTTKNPGELLLWRIL